MDCSVDTLIIGQLGFELLAPSGSEAVKTDFPIGFGDTPFRGGPTLQENSLQRRIKGSFFYFQHFGREAMNPLGDCVAVESSGAKNSQDQKDERARRHLSVRHSGIMASVDATDMPCQVLPEGGTNWDSEKPRSSPPSTSPDRIGSQPCRGNRSRRMPRRATFGSWL